MSFMNVVLGINIILLMIVEIVLVGGLLYGFIKTILDYINKT